MSKTVLFDFDGTLADTLYEVVNIINSLSREFGYSKIKKKDIPKIRNKTAQEILKEAGISMFKLPFIVKRARLELNKVIEFLKPVQSIREVLLVLKKRRYKLGIVTSNSKENVEKFLKKNNFELFDFIYSGSSIFGKHKLLKDTLKKQNLKPNEVIYVGDETRDIEAARKNQIKIIAVIWGFNSRKILENYHPDFLIDKPKELLEILEV